MKRQNLWKLRIRSIPEIQKCLRVLLPYLFTKRQQALLMLEFCALENNQQNSVTRECIYDELKSLNKQ